MMSLSKWLALGSALSFLAVCLGAFGAHALKGKLDSYSLDVYEKAFTYHFAHALGILIVVLALKADLVSPSLGMKSLPAFLCGIILFSGSLYLLAITGIKWLGAITPIGGTLFLIGWAILFVAALKK